MPRGIPAKGYRESPTTFPRVHPLERYNDGKFLARYRLDKAFVQEFARHFGASEFCPVKGMPQGDGIPIVDRVCRFFHVFYSVFCSYCYFHPLNITYISVSVFHVCLSILANNVQI